MELEWISYYGDLGMRCNQDSIPHFSTASQLPIQCVPGASPLRVMRTGREADHSLSCNAEVKNAWSNLIFFIIGGAVLSP
jgi:hypothetical protein